MCFLVGVALLWCDYHWLTDVVAGWALAALIVWAVWRAERRVAAGQGGMPAGIGPGGAQRHRAEEHTR